SSVQDLPGPIASAAVGEELNFVPYSNATFGKRLLNVIDATVCGLELLAALSNVIMSPCTTAMWLGSNVHMPVLASPGGASGPSLSTIITCADSAVAGVRVGGTR